MRKTGGLNDYGERKRMKIRHNQKKDIVMYKKLDIYHIMCPFSDGSQINKFTPGG